MTPSAAGFAQRVVAWQRTHGRNDLPWSMGGDADGDGDADSDGASGGDSGSVRGSVNNGHHAYRVWLSEVMLQQTQVATVRGYFAAFTARLPTLADLARANIDEVLALWAGLGYYSRARNLHRCAQLVMTQHGGVFPSDLTALQALPGIGPSTAAAIASLAFGQRAAILDGNVKRVLARHGAVAGWPGTPVVANALWALANARLVATHQAAPPDHHRRYTQGMMDLGATVCHAKQPDCPSCPLASDCAALAGGLIASIPAPRPKKTAPVQARSALILHTEHGLWLTRRPAQGLWGGLLSLPEAAQLTELQQMAAEWLNQANNVADARDAADAADVVDGVDGVDGVDVVDVANLTLATPQYHPTTPRPIPAIALQPWHIHTLKHTFTHYQLHWTVWALAVTPAFCLPAPWVFVQWAAVKSVGVPKAVLKVLGQT
jgi:A/G-specific adenine glycosylase